MTRKLLSSQVRRAKAKRATLIGNVFLGIGYSLLGSVVLCMAYLAGQTL
jgi:hypothetical protein